MADGNGDYASSFGLRKVCARLTSLLFVMFVLHACTTRPDEAPEIRTQVPQEAVDLFDGAVEPLVSDFGQNVESHSILALSSGGADGAYGAGVLAGWTKSGNRPNFDVVTGVSTGALLAVLAFLGPQYDPLMKELYTAQTNRMVFRKKGVDGLLSSSLYDNTPFKDQIERYVTAKLMVEVGAAHKQGRRLYIATTNLDGGELVIWDMGMIALGEGGGRADSLQHFQKVLRASAAVPVVFEPVYIKPRRGVQLRQAHVDGGVKAPILYDKFMARSAAKQRDLYVIINGTTRRYNAYRPVEASLGSISQKTVSELLRELLLKTINTHYNSTVADGMGFYITSIPDEIPIAEDVLDFDPVRMNRLFEAGFSVGSRGLSAWKTRPVISNSGSIKVQ